MARFNDGMIEPILVFVPGFPSSFPLFIKDGLLIDENMKAVTIQRLIECVETEIGCDMSTGSLISLKMQNTTHVDTEIVAHIAIKLSENIETYVAESLTPGVTIRLVDEYIKTKIATNCTAFVAIYFSWEQLNHSNKGIDDIMWDDILDDSGQTIDTIVWDNFAYKEIR